MPRHLFLTAFCFLGICHRGTSRASVRIGNVAPGFDDSDFTLMGGSLASFVLNLHQGGDLTRAQYDTILEDFVEDKGDLIYFDHHNLHYDPKLGQELLIYLEDETDSDRMTEETFQYLYSLFNLGDLPNTSSSHLPPASNQLVQAGVPAFYTGNGNVNFLGKLSFGTSNLYNGIWGYAAGVREYALQCNSDGFHIIDVTDPTDPQRIQFKPMGGGSTWRDVDIHYSPSTGKTYAYVGAQGGSNANLWVVDLSYLSNTATGDGVDSNPIPPSGFVDRGRTHYSHTLTVNDELGLLFTNSAGSQDRGCQIFDLLADPWNPPIIASHLGDCHDSMARKGVAVPGQGLRDLLYSADGYSNRFRIVDITNVRSGGGTTVLGETTPQSSQGEYGHQNYISDDSKYLYVFDEFNRYDIAIWNVEDPSNPEFIRTLQWSGEGTEGNSIVHNGQVRGNYLLCAYYEAGFRVFDISNPANPIEVGKYETYRDPDGNGVLQQSISGGYDGAWNLYSFLPSGNVLVSDLNTGTFIFEVDPVDLADAPVNLAASEQSGTVVLSWDAPSGGGVVTGYTIKRGTAAGVHDTILATNVMGTTYSDATADLTEGAANYYVVTATNAEGEGGPSNEVVFAYVSSPTGSPTTSSPAGSPTPSPTTETPTTPAPTPCSGDNKMFTISLLTDNYPLETTWDVKDSSGATVLSGGPYSNSGTLYEISQCIAGDACTFTINDSYGDGICCSYGVGNYELSMGTFTRSGGFFASSEAIDMCPSTPTDPPTKSPTSPTDPPTESPTKTPTMAPTDAPTKTPTMAPTKTPTEAPTGSPTKAPTPSPPGSDHYVVCGRRNACGSETEGLKPDSELHEVRCCREEELQELQELPGWVKRGACKVYGESIFEGACYENMNYADAAQVCSDHGGRLCTKGELEMECTRGSGCSHDTDLIWSKTDDTPTNAPTPAPVGTDDRLIVCGRSGRCTPAFMWIDKDSENEVRCCTDDNLVLGWTKKCTIGGNEVWGESDIGGQCYHAETYDSAVSICAGVGARLCTQEELLADCTSGTGCGHDADLVWANP